MNLDLYVSVSGFGALFKLVTSRNNGLILESLENGKSKFYPVRKHQFTPLGTVAIYTLEDTVSLMTLNVKIDESKGTRMILLAISLSHIDELSFIFRTIILRYLGPPCGHTGLNLACCIDPSITRFS